MSSNVAGWEIPCKSHDGSVCMVYMMVTFTYIYHQYTQNVSINLPYIHGSVMGMNILVGNHPGFFPPSHVSFPEGISFLVSLALNLLADVSMPGTSMILHWFGNDVHSSVALLARSVRQAFVLFCLGLLSGNAWFLERVNHQ